MGDELEAIRQQRLAQLQSQYGGVGGGGNNNNPEQQKAREEQKRVQEEAKHSILSQILNQEARGRLNTLKLSKPEKGAMLENMIIQMAQMGQIAGKLDDAQLVGLLEKVNAQMPQQTSKVKYDRRRAAIDSDDDEDYGF